MNPTWFRGFAALCIFALAACGDETESNDDGDVAIGADAGADVVDLDAIGGDATDVGADTADDSGTTDAGDDTGADVGADATDAAADAAADTADAAADVATDAPVVPTCDMPPRCATDDDCVGDDVCAFGTCVVPAPASDYVVTGDFSRVTAITLGAPGTVVSRDVDGDGEPENVLGDLLAAFPGGREQVETSLAEFVGNGLLSLFTEVLVDESYCGGTEDTFAARVIVHRGTRDLDNDGLDDGGAARVLASSFDGLLGPGCALNYGAVDPANGAVRASTDGSCALVMPLFGDIVINLDIQALTIEMSPSAAKAGETTAVVSGYVQLQSIVDEANRIGATCACAGIDTGMPVAETYESGGIMRGRCLQDVDGADACVEGTDGVACPNLPGLCTAVTVMGGAADISSNNDGTRDAFSVGLQFETETTPVAEPAVTAGLQAIGDHYSAITAMDWGYAIRDGAIGVMANDEFDAALDTLQSATLVSPETSDVYVAVEEGRILVSASPDFPTAGEVDLVIAYTIGDGDTRASTANATLRLVAKTDRPFPGADAFDVTYPGGTVTLDVLANDEAFGNTLRIQAVSGIDPMGVIAVNADGSALEYTPNGIGYDGFTYEVSAWSEAGGWSEPVSAELAVYINCGAEGFGPSCEPCPACSGGGVCDAGPEGSGACLCPEGSYAEGDACVDIDECAVGGSQPACFGFGEVCVNTSPGYECQCDVGFVDVGGYCEPPCGDSGVACGYNAYCNDALEPMQCECYSGFEGDGVTCTDIDECETPGLCPEGTYCVNFEGAYECYSEG